MRQRKTKDSTCTKPVPARALETHIAIVGKTGSGKSNLAKILAEDLLARGERVCVFDPTGTWWGLRLARDGRTASTHPIVIFGGGHGDLPASPDTGAAIAEAIAATTTPAIIDTRELTVAGRSALFTTFAETLLRANRGALTLIVDEAHLFMPQGGTRGGGVAPAMLHAGNNLVSLGRGAGLRIVLITQRPAKLHKDSLTQVETLVAMRLVAPQDRRAIEDWIGEWASGEDGRAIKRSLPSLETGEAWVWSPGLDHLERVRCPLAATYDSGQVSAHGGPALAPIDVQTIAAKLAAAHEHGDRRDNTGNSARRGAQARRITELETTLDTEREAHGRTRERAEAARKTLEAVRAALAGTETTPEDTPPAPTPREPHAPTTVRSHTASPGTKKISAPMRKILDALAWLEATGIAARPERAQVAFVAGYKPRGGSFNNTLGALRSAGLVAYPGPGTVALTGTGRNEGDAGDTPATDEALHAAVMARLSEPQRRVLNPLLDAWPRDIDIDALAAAAGYEPRGGSFNNTRGRLRTLGLIEYPAPGRAVARHILFIDNAQGRGP